jgi:hypothetical protein
MTKAKLRKMVIILASVAALTGGLSIETAYARGGGGFGHAGMGGGFGHMGTFGGPHFTGASGMDRGLAGRGIMGSSGLGLHHHREFDAWGPRCGDWLANANPDCTLPN